MKTYTINMPGDLDKKYRSFQYPAGERQVRILDTQFESLELSDKIVVTATITDGNPIELLLLIDAIVSLNCIASLDLILPYLPYARADRRFVKGDCVGLSTFARAIDVLSINKTVTFDVHSREARFTLPTLRNVEPYPVIKYVLSNYLVKPTIILPDKGSLERYDLKNPVFDGYPIVHCDKVRDVATGALSGFAVPEIGTKNAVIIDDLCDGGGTFVGIAEVLRRQQPDVIVDLYVSHGIFSKGLQQLSMYFGHIYTTDSFPPMAKYAIDWSEFHEMVTIYPIGGILKGTVLSTEELFQQI